MLQVKIRANFNSADLKQKFEMAYISANKGAQVACAESAGKIRDDVAKFVSRNFGTMEEINALMRGTVYGGKFDGRIAGTHEGGRLDFSSFVPLSRAIKNCPVTMGGEKMGLLASASPSALAASILTGGSESISLIGGRQVRAFACTYSEINAQKKFEYTRNDGSKHTANPFHGKMMQAVEHGGVWDVLPKHDRAMLSPEFGVAAKRMRKIMKPLHPFAKVIIGSRHNVRQNVARTIKEYVAFIRLGRQAPNMASYGIYEKVMGFLSPVIGGSPTGTGTAF